MLPPLPARKSYDDVPRDSLAYALFLNPLMEVDPLDNNNDEPPTLKTLTARLKHMPGKHDQSSHGKPGRVGSAFRGAYSAARAGGASHVEARNQAKTAAEQVRQTIRGEKREQVAKRAVVRTPTTPTTSPRAETASPKPKQSNEDTAARLTKSLENVTKAHEELKAELRQTEKIKDPSERLRQQDIARAKYQKAIDNNEVIGA